MIVSSDGKPKNAAEGHLWKKDTELYSLPALKLFVALLAVSILLLEARPVLPEAPVYHCELKSDALRSEGLRN